MTLLKVCVKIAVLEESLRSTHMMKMKPFAAFAVSKSIPTCYKNKVQLVHIPSDKWYRRESNTSAFTYLTLVSIGNTLENYSYFTVPSYTCCRQSLLRAVIFFVIKLPPHVETNAAGVSFLQSVISALKTFVTSAYPLPGNNRMWRHPTFGNTQGSKRTPSRRMTRS